MREIFLYTGIGFVSGLMAKSFSPKEMSSKNTWLFSKNEIIIICGSLITTFIIIESLLSALLCSTSEWCFSHIVLLNKSVFKSKYIKKLPNQIVLKEDLLLKPLKLTVFNKKMVDTISKIIEKY